MNASPTDGLALQRAHARTMVRRFPVFALCWLGGVLVWTAVLIAGPGLPASRAVLVVAVQLALLLLTVAVVRTLVAPRAILAAIVACSVALGTGAVGAFVLAGGDGDFLAFVLLTLYLATSLFFGWGWRPALVVLAATVVAWLVALPRLTVHVPRTELVGAIVMGSMLSLGIAEGYARGFRAAFDRERERDAVSARERAALAEAEEARAAAEEAARAKDRFLAIVSHELRSPLGAALSWSYVLRRHQLDEEAGRALAAVEHSVRLSVRLIEDLLDVSRIAQGKFRLDVTDVDLRGVVSGVAEGTRLAAEAKRVTLAVALPDAPLRVHGDAVRLRQIVENLLSNAVKFTPAGGRVEVQLRARAAEVDVTVRDTGVGIAPNVLPHIFDPFRQGEASVIERGGLGLGLAIVRQLVEAHGGVVEATSEGPGHGATFRVTLPVVPESVSRPASSRGRDH